MRRQPTTPRPRTTPDTSEAPPRSGLRRLQGDAGVPRDQDTPAPLTPPGFESASADAGDPVLTKRSPMPPWPNDELRAIAEIDGLHISPFRSDGTTYGTPRWIWSVVVGNDLYVRPTTAGTPAGTRPRCLKAPAGSRQPLPTTRSPSREQLTPSTASSIRRTQPSITTAPASLRCCRNAHGPRRSGLAPDRTIAAPRQRDTTLEP